MTKRSPDFEKRPRDFYPTPEKGVLPLLPLLGKGETFAEPCVGEGDLVEHLGKHGLICNWASDIEDRLDGKFDYFDKLDALELTSDHVKDCDYIITNPPWSRKILHPMIDHFRKLRPTWLLLDADWAHTKQARPYLKYCSLIVSVGRLKWIPESKYSGLDNCAWYLFDTEDSGVGPVFINKDWE